MKSIVRSGIIFLCSLSVILGSIGCVSAELMTDPLMGVTFDPNTIHFEQFPSSPQTAKELGVLPKWIFGAHHDKQVGARVYILAGFHMVHPDGPGKAVKEPDFGAVIRVTGQQIDVLGVPDRLFEGTGIVPPDIVESLVRDAVHRYVVAFGGPLRLGRLMDQQGVSAENIPAVLVIALQQQGVPVHRGKVSAK